MEAVPSRVLLLDDDEDFRELCGELLVALGVDVGVIAGSLHDLERREADVLACNVAILDINLGPEQPNGIDVWRWLVSHGFEGKIAFLTGHAASHPLVVQAAETARALVLSKPLEPSRLVEFIRGPGR